MSRYVSSAMHGACSSAGALSGFGSTAPAIPGVEYSSDDPNKAVVIWPLPDGTTVAQRELYAALVSDFVHKTATDLQRVLDNELSLLSVLNRPAFTIPATAEQRAILQQAKVQLENQFLMAALTAIRDYNRDLKEVKQSITDYLNTTAKQVGVATSQAAESNIMAFWNQVLIETEKLAQKGVAVAAETVGKTINTAAQKATEGNPWVKVGIAIAALFAVGYAVRAFK